MSPYLINELEMGFIACLPCMRLLRILRQPRRDPNSLQLYLFLLRIWSPSDTWQREPCGPEGCWPFPCHAQGQKVPAIEKIQGIIYTPGHQSGASQPQEQKKTDSSWPCTVSGRSGCGEEWPAVGPATCVLGSDLHAFSCILFCFGIIL